MYFAAPIVRTQKSETGSSRTSTDAQSKIIVPFSRLIEDIMESRVGATGS